MVVTEREPSPQQGHSPSLSDANLKDGIEGGLSPIPRSHSSAEDRASSGFGTCTDQELSDCPITPQTPPACLTFLQRFPSECETPPSTTPFPKLPEPSEQGEEFTEDVESEDRQFVQISGEEGDVKDSISKEECEVSEYALGHIEKEENEWEGETDSATLVEEKERDEKVEEYSKEETKVEFFKEETEAKYSKQETEVETQPDEVEKYVESSEQTETNWENLEENSKEEECIKFSVQNETTSEAEKSEEYTEEVETKFSEQSETKVKIIESEWEVVNKECEEFSEQKEEVEKVVSCEQTASEETVTTIKVEEISVNQLWNLWSNSAPKVEEQNEEKSEEVPSAGQTEKEVLENSIEPKEQLQIINEQPNDDLNDTRLKLGDAERRIHEMEIEIKRLENEREELNSAYREAETLRKQEEAKAQRLTAELTQVRHDYEKRLISKEEEIEALRKQMQIEIEQLSQRVAEAEAKVKTEVARIKKKMQVQITELEMSLDVANKQNIDMQKTIKKQSLQITELQAHYDEIHRQLQQTVDQLGVSQRRCQVLQAELEETRVNLEQALRAKRATELQLEEVTSRINELNTLNINLTSAKSKLEAEFMSLQSDYEEINKELRISDERYNRVQIELKSTKDVLIEEQERLVKIESIKKSLEIEVHNLQVRIEEVEANALAGGKRVVSKLESRIRDIEIEFEEEKRRHVETQKVLRKKEHRIKELIVQCEEDHQALTILNDSVDKLSEKCKMYKRQLVEQEGMSQQNLTRVRRFQRELEAAEERADQAESNLSLIRAKHRSWVTTSQIPGGLKQVIVTEETSTSTSQY